MQLPLLLAAAHAADAPASPEFLLADVGVRIDLPAGWRMTRWSDWDFSAKSADESVLVFAWATPWQVPVASADGWEPVFAAKVLEMSGKDPRRVEARVAEFAGRKVALIDEAFRFADGGNGTMYAATLEVPGKDFHLVAVSADRAAAAGRRARQDLLGRLEFAAPPPEPTFGTEVAAKGVTTRLPDDWRPSLDAEWTGLGKSLTRLGLSDLTECWIAVRPKPAADPDVMATCTRPLHVGVVDLYSAPSVDEALRAKLLGKGAPAGVPVELADRLGFVWSPRDGVAFGAVPTAEGVVVLAATGEGDLAPSVRAAMSGSTFTGPHPVELGDRVAYWLGERTFSPQVLCPISGCALGGLGVAGALAAAAVLGARRSADAGGDEPGPEPGASA